ncbi:MAG: LssY C-terminal domain-containing protein [Gammaproteobacteria bacterium]
MKALSKRTPFIYLDYRLQTLTFLLAMLLAGCASYVPRPIATPPLEQVNQSSVVDDVQVSTTILSDDQAAQHYGVDLASRGLQAIWLQIRNDSSSGLWFLVAALDGDYYSPNEAAILFYSGMAADERTRITQYFRSQALPLRVEAGTSVEGYVLAPRHEGGRFINVELVGEDRRLQFGTAIPIAGERLDFEDLETTALYSANERRDLNAGELRQVLRELPCCTTNADSEGQGDPVNVVLVGDEQQVLTALARSGWSFTHELDFRSVSRLIGAAIAGTPYAIAPISPLYLFGREQDVAMQRARTAISQRNHMRLWMTPFYFEGRPVWAGQISRDIGVKLTTKSSSLTTHIIDRHVDETREYLLQSLLVHHMVERFGFVSGVGATTPQEPRLNLTGDPYETDGLRLVVVLAPEFVQPQHARNFHWREDTDPMLRIIGTPQADN